MRKICGIVAVGAVMAAAGGCAPMLNGFAVSPACGMQSRAYRQPSAYVARQQVAQIQSRYSYRSASYAGPLRGAEGWKSLASGECR